MDKATRIARARAKAQNTPRGELSPFEPRGLGRKGRPSQTFPARNCDYIVGGKKVPIRRRRKDNTLYTLMIVVGGAKCLAKAVVTKDGKAKCLAHSGR